MPLWRKLALRLTAPTTQRCWIRQYTSTLPLSGRRRVRTRAREAAVWVQRAGGGAVAEALMLRRGRRGRSEGVTIQKEPKVTIPERGSRHYAITRVCRHVRLSRKGRFLGLVRVCILLTDIRMRADTHISLVSQPEAIYMGAEP